MFKKLLSKENKLDTYLYKAKKFYAKAIVSELKDLELNSQTYSTDLAVEELGLDAELIESLVDDFVMQIIKYKPVFMMHIHNLAKQESAREVLDYQPLRDLAHKNLGVARNLRIINAQKILKDIMVEEDFDYLAYCVEVVEAYAITLRPEIAYKTSQDIKIKI